MTFSHPAMLWGLAAVAIPVIIHLLRLRRYRTVYFSNVERLEATSSAQRRHDTIRQWLVLAARVLAIALLALAFAGPSLRRRQATADNTQAAVSIFIDNSFSMSLASADGSMLDEACRRAKELVAAYPVDTRFQVLSGDMTGTQMHLLGSDEAVDAIDQLTSSAAAPTLAEAASRQASFLRQAQARSRHAYIISDFQRSVADLAAMPADSTVSFTLVPLQGVEAANLYVDSVALDAPAYHAGGSVEATVTVANSGQADAHDVPVRLMADGRERALATVDVPAAGKAKCTMRFSLAHGGTTEGMVTIEDYPVTFDNRYHFVISSGDPITVLEIDAAQANPSLARLFANDSLVRFSHTGTPRHDIEDCDMVVLNELTTISSGASQQLQRWVTDGGSLLVIAPEGHATDALNGLLASLGAPQLGQWVATPAKATSVDGDAPLYRGVFSAKTDDMEMPLTEGHYTLTGTGHTARSIITLAGNTPLLTHTTVGDGSVYLLATPLRAELNTLVGQAMFVPTFYNMALFARPLPPAAHTIGSHDPIALAHRHPTDTKPDQLEGADGFSLLPDLRTVGGRQVMVQHGELTADGIYTLGDERLAFNYPRRESRMEFMTQAEIERAVADRDNLSLLAPSKGSLTDQLRERQGGRPLWRWCLALALAMLLAETIIIRTTRR
ncbi:MAG: BatA domain-containing protein [Bacteroidales bacterium]|nr:BatA domain-containing protein [Bacteroidales bacterium]